MIKTVPAVNVEDSRFPLGSGPPYAFCAFARTTATNSKVEVYELGYTGTYDDDWNPYGSEIITNFKIPGLAARAFGLDRLTYEDVSGYYREKTTGYFDRLILNGNKRLGNEGGTSVIHTQQANRDNLFMSYFLHQYNEPDEPHRQMTYPRIDVFQIAP